MAMEDTDAPSTRRSLSDKRDTPAVEEKKTPRSSIVPKEQVSILTIQLTERDEQMKD
jgi:hypothetical protein